MRLSQKGLTIMKTINNIVLELKELSMDDLKNRYRTIYNMVNILDCYNSEDILCLTLMAEELANRGITISEVLGMPQIDF